MHPERTPERKYALTKIGPGDWLLPSNDAQVLWRIAVYEDGPSHGVEFDTADRDWWGLWRWTGSTGEGAYVDTTDWNCWEMFDSRYETRRAAIDGAMRHDALRDGGRG